MVNKLMLKRTIAWTLLGVTVLFLLSGFGITQYQIITPLTFGLLGKALSFQLHEWLWIPFGLLLILHVYLGMYRLKSKV